MQGVSLWKHSWGTWQWELLPHTQPLTDACRNKTLTTEEIICNSGVIIMLPSPYLSYLHVVCPRSAEKQGFTLPFFSIKVNNDIIENKGIFQFTSLPQWYIRSYPIPAFLYPMITHPQELKYIARLPGRKWPTSICSCFCFFFFFFFFLRLKTPTAIVRYIDNLLTLNNSSFEKEIPNIFPPQLEL